MITHLFGILDHVDSNRITIDVNGVGYEVYVPASLFSRLPKVGQKVKIFTYQHVKEDGQELYGFKGKEEKNLFSLLLSVSGIGPKGALNLVGGIELDQLVIAITKGNVDLLTTAPGIGSKTAQRLVVELKEKLAKTYGISPAEIAKGLPGEEPTLKDAVSALMTLGYSPREARQAILSAGIDLKHKLTIEEIIKKALKVLS